MTRLVPRLFVLLICALAVVLPARAGQPLARAAELSARAAELSLTVFAAADLAFAFKELVPKFEKALGAKVTLVLGSTGNLAKQIENGAPADVFFAADQSFLNGLVTKGVIIAETRVLYAQGRLALVRAKTIEGKLQDVPDLLNPAIRHVAIANPQHAPYGRAAQEALERLGLWDTVKPRLVYGENVRQALQFVQSGAAEAGIVAFSVANVPEVTWIAVDPKLHAPLSQMVGVTRRSARPELGLGFIQFVNGPEGRPVMKRYGFLLPGEF